MSTSSKAGSGEFTGRHMWMLAIGFFGVVITVNITMAVISATSWTGLVVDNSYVASQEFEEKRLAHQAQLDAGWISSLSYAGGQALLSVADGNGAAIDLGQPVLRINRPVGGHDDQQVTLVRQPDGTYVGPVALSPGVWEALVSVAETPLGPYEIHERFRIEGVAP
ncbi:FixH family protein [Devosia sp.]|uniref:FixH family protein n=1 Tax=Devosia sp. TaxID=1871048 RepID=UPI001ACB30B9|nr:FixH family protein [Devosia sp.]MBN9310665.1 FixH family protein [Devosia sp.]